MLSSFFGIIYFDNQPKVKQGLEFLINNSLNKLAHWDYKFKNSWASRDLSVGLGEISNNINSKNNLEKYRCVSDSLDPRLSADLSKKDFIASRMTGDYFDFAFGQWDEKSQKLFCARDHIGVRPLFYTQTQNYFAFASEIKGLLALPEVKLEAKPSEQWLVEYLAHSNLDSNRTYYKNIFRLRSAQSLELNRLNRRLEIKKYWNLSDAPNIKFKKPEDYVEAFKEKLWAAVSKRLGNKTACELSGGLDSTSIAAVANNILRDPGLRSLSQTPIRGQGDSLRCYSHVLPKDIKNLDKSYKPQDEYSEIEDFLKFSKISQSSQHKFISSENISAEAAIDRALFLQDSPSTQTFTMFSDELNDKAKADGCDVLLSGFGGDEMATGHAPSWHYELAYANKWWTLWFELNARHKNWRLKNIYNNLKKMALFALEIKLPKVYQSKFGKFKNLLFDYDDYSFNDSLVAQELAQKYKISGRGFGSLAWRSFKTVREQQEYDFASSKHLALRVESSYIHAKHKNLEISFPLLDKDLLEFCIGVPACEKRKMPYGRWLMRRAMKGYVPDSLRLRQHKGGAAIPGAQHRQNLIWDSLGFDNLKSLEFFNFKKLLDNQKLSREELAHEDKGIMRLSILYAGILNRFLSKSI